MPNLNLKDEGSIHHEKAGGGGSDHAEGKAGFTIIIIIMALAIVGGGVFLLNNMGILKLWGPKAKKVAVAPAASALIDSAKLAAASKAKSDSLEAASRKNPRKMMKESRKEAMREMKREESKRQPPMEKPKAKAEVSKPAPAPSGPGEFTIQLASFSDQDKAESYASMLHGNGIEAYVGKTESAKGTMFCVRVGKFGSIKEAKDAAAKFVNAVPPAIVVKAD